MNTRELLYELKANGIKVVSDGKNLTIKADREPRADLIEKIRLHKAPILDLLQREGLKWTPSQWRDYFEERAAISEFDHGQSRRDAENNAFHICIGEWMRQNSVTSLPAVCHQCRKMDGLIQPYLAGGDAVHPAHVWLHQHCADQWHRIRQDKAIASLKLLGISPRSPSKEIAFVETN